MTNWRKINEETPKNTPIDLFAIHVGPLPYGCRFPNVKFDGEDWIGKQGKDDAVVGDNWTPVMWAWIDFPSINKEMLEEIEILRQSK